MSEVIIKKIELDLVEECTDLYAKTYSSEPWIEGKEYYIDEFFVDVDEHGQGIGTKLMLEIKKDLITKGIHAILLNTEKNYPSKIFYESVGFKAEENLIILDSTF